MRPRKASLTLTADTLRAVLIPGKTYTRAVLANMFDASPARLVEILQTLVADGVLHYGRGTTDIRNARYAYWLVIAPPLGVATPPRQPGHAVGRLDGYQARLDRFRALCEATR